MKKEVLANLLNLKNKEMSVYFPSGQSNFWTIGIIKNNLVFYIRLNEYDTDLIDLKVKYMHNEFKLSFTTKEINPFIDEMRKSCEVLYNINFANEKKREQILKMMKEAEKIENTDHISMQKKENMTFHFLSVFLFKKDNAKLNFYCYEITESDNSKSIINKYHILLTFQEKNEIFNINLKKEKNDKFEKKLGFIFPKIQSTKDILENKDVCNSEIEINSKKEKENNERINQKLRLLL